MSHLKAEPYQFPDAETLQPKVTAQPEPPPEETSADSPGTPKETPSRAAPLSYAQTQADQMLLTAKRQAEEILEQARQEAQEQAEALYENARKDGWDAGYQEGTSQGMAKAVEENQRVRSEQLKALAAEVERFLEQASAALDRQMDENIGEMRDLAVAVAEKVIAVSLKSSSDVVERMIQTAVDKRKKREWVRIHVSEYDAKRMTRVSPALTAALAALSDQVRIIPIADEETGTCIIEMPDEIIDASAATQLNNIRTMLAEIPADGTENSTGSRGGSLYHVSPDDPPAL